MENNSPKRQRRAGQRSYKPTKSDKIREQLADNNGGEGVHFFWKPVQGGFAEKTAFLGMLQGNQGVRILKSYTKVIHFLVCMFLKIFNHKIFRA